MSGQKKLPRVTAAVAKRVKRADYEQPRHGRCLVCGGDWDTCPHDRGQAEAVVSAVQTAEMLGLAFPE